MKQIRLQIRFKKNGDLRMIGHRDLARAFERLLRRVELPLAMSEGFHPHPKINFPSALAVGVEGESEVVEVAVADEVELGTLHERLAGQLPDGLTIVDVRVMGTNEPKTHVEQVEYSLPVPNEQCESVKAKIAEFLTAESWPVERTNRRGTKQVDIRPGVHALELDNNNQLSMRLETTQTYNVKPREILALLGIENIEDYGAWLTRTCVYLAS
ncbi:MAG: TIGR03936 family radical SAM-associated protein [Planctomycetales bacterium]|nr:TIGR03936 family radical SAM-associated protein [Planctomycetales bacterium]